MNTIDPRTADRLAKITGLLGSGHVGERAAAALLASRLLDAAGLSWDELVRRACSVAPEVAQPTSQRASAYGSPQARARRLLTCPGLLSGWERRFLTGIAEWRGQLTPAQLARLVEIEAAMQARRAA